MSGVEDNNLDSEKILRIWWTGVKYAYDSKTDITFAWDEQLQNNFRVPQTCSVEAGFRASSCGALNEGSLYADHHFTKRFDGFVGAGLFLRLRWAAIAIPHGPGVPYLHNSNFAPTIGGPVHLDRAENFIEFEPRHGWGFFYCGRVARRSAMLRWSAGCSRLGAISAKGARTSGVVEGGGGEG